MKIFWTVVLIVAVVCGVYYYKHYRSEKLLADGDIQCTGCMTPERKAEFLKENAGEDADGNKERKSTHGNISADDKGQTVTGTTSSTGVTTATTTASAPVYPPAQTPVYPAAQTVSTSAATGYGAPPVSDTIAPNPPNGMVFGGKGTYQWYRQGNITWRVDTVTGRSCIVFATDEEWRKERVLAHGCGRSA